MAESAGSRSCTVTAGQSPAYPEAPSVRLTCGDTTETPAEASAVTDRETRCPNKVLVHATAWTSLENIMLRDRHAYKDHTL